jgi:hypothetical protein
MPKKGRETTSNRGAFGKPRGKMGKRVDIPVVLN